MRGQLMKSLFSLVILLFLGSLLTTLVWYVLDHSSNVEPRRAPPQKKSTPESTDLCKGCSRNSSPKPVLKDQDRNQTASITVKEKLHSNVEPRKAAPQKKSDLESANLCKGCREIIDKVRERFSQTWKKQEDNYQKFKSQLSSNCSGSDKAVITQANTAVGTKIVYDGEKKRSLQVTQEIFSTFAKERPFPNKTWDTCAVVGNGGILTNSSCGQMIDSAQFVIRCNLPPLGNGYGKHVGVKTNLVTANPSILINKYGALMGRRRPFVESLRTYGDSLLLIPAFSFGAYTPVSLRAVYTIEDFESPTKPIFFNPEYLQSLGLFWRSQGLREARLSSGIIMASLALELCANVHLYGFWPFSNHPHGLHALTNHYYDDRPAQAAFHAMPAEFDLLLRLHSQGVLRLHLGDCQSGEK